MPFPETLAEKQVAQILEKKGLVEQPVPAPVYHPRSSFHEEAGKWRKRLYSVLPVATGVGINTILYSQAPTFYRPENAFYIGALTLAGAIGGVLLAEGLSYYFADRDSR